MPRRRSAERHLWQLMDDVAHARSLEEICEHALGCLHDALGVERSSVLLFDENKVMKFVAWRGLSEPYRQAVEGHSPWAPEETDAEPIVIPDVNEDASVAPLLDVLQAENIRALAFIPLRFGGRLLGKFMFYYPEAHSFSQDELALSRLIAGHIGFAVEQERRLRAEQQDRQRAEEEILHRRQAERQKDRLVEELDMLAKASDLMASALHPDAALDALAHFVVGKMADCCVAYRLEDDGSIHHSALAHADSARQALVQNLVEIAPPSIEDDHGVGAVLRTGEPSLIREIDREYLEKIAKGAAHLRLLEQIAFHSGIIVPLKARDRILGALAFSTTDLSDRRYAMSDLTLARLLARRAALLVDNARLYRQAQEATRTRDEMMTVVSHDLRSPLNTIVTCCELSKIDPSPSRQEETRASILRSANRMSRLLEDLLEVAHLDEQRVPLQKEEVDLSELLDELVVLHRPVAQDKDITLSRQLNDGVSKVVADRARLIQALSNLVDNAVKFTEAGGEVRMSASRAGDAVRIAISDDGPGIAAEQIPRLFERFWRADGQKQAGVGLGLAIVKGVAEAHGGDIEVTSEPNQGACFSVLIPSRSTHDFH